MKTISLDRYFDLTLEECVEVLNHFDELIITDEKGYIKYFSPNVIPTCEKYFDNDESLSYVGKHISKVNPTTLMPRFILDKDDERNIFHLANSCGTVARFKKVMKNGSLLMTLDYDLFRDEIELKKFLYEVINLDDTNLFDLNEPIEDVRNRILGAKRMSSMVNNIIGESPQIKELKKQIYNIAHTNATVIICGETGTGKELFARAIHATSSRAQKPFIEVNSAAIPENLFESELFGYEGGTFTGAKKEGMKGKFELADKGTLFLDEIDQIPYHMQPKLLRALQEKSIAKIGSDNIPVDVRIITATNKNLLELIEEEKFRKDLYYRLNVIPFNIPPLRERKEDIKPLAEAFIKEFNKNFNKDVEAISNEALSMLYQYNWPGNIRELRNAVERAVITTQHKVLEPIEFEHMIRQEFNNIEAGGGTLEQVRANAEKQAISMALELSNNISGAAKILGITRPTLYDKMEKYGITKR